MTETYFAQLSQASPGLQLQHLISSYWIAQAIGVAADLGIAHLLATGPKSSGELAQATGTHSQALYRLLRALASVGVFTEVDPERFGLTPMAEPLRAEAPASLRAMALYLCRDVHWRTWGQLGYSIHTGQPAFKQVHGMENYEYCAQHAVAVLTHCRRVLGPHGTLLLAEEVIPAGDTPAYGKLIDLNMLVAAGGLERTEAEYRALYAAAGFALTRVILTRSRISLIEGTPV